MNKLHVYHLLFFSAQFIKNNLLSEKFTPQQTLTNYCLNVQKTKTEINCFKIVEFEQISSIIIV